jgi:predicted nucleic acid-binding protein
MRALLDSNVVIDVIEHRDDFFDDSYEVMRHVAEGKLDAIIPAGSVSDIYYIIRRGGKSADATRDAIAALLQIVNICDTTASDVSHALTMNLSDFEDAIVASTAKREKVDYIITRNERDFIGIPIPPISPTDFLAKHA